MDLFEKTISEVVAYDDSVIKLVVQDVLLPDGNVSKRDVIRHPGGVAVLAFLDEETVLMVEQFRKPLDAITLELPAGKRENGEDPEVTGRRELEEETGYKAEKFEYLGKIATTPGFCDEFIYLFKAEKLYKGTIGGDEDEFINVRKVKLTDYKNMVKSGEIYDAKTVSILSYI